MKLGFTYNHSTNRERLLSTDAACEQVDSFQGTGGQRSHFSLAATVVAMKGLAVRRR